MMPPVGFPLTVLLFIAKFPLLAMAPLGVSHAPEQMAVIPLEGAIVQPYSAAAGDGATHPALNAKQIAMQYTA